MVIWGKSKSEEALSILNKALSADTNHKNKWLRLYLYYYYREDDMEKALNYLDDALAIDSSFTLAKIEKSYTYDPNSNCREVINLLQDIPISYENADLESFLGDAFYICDDIGKAKIRYQKSIDINPNSYAYYGLGRISHYMENNFSEAENYYLSSLKYDSSYSEAYVDLGWVYYEMDDLIKAENSFKKAIELEPTQKRYNDIILYFFKSNNLYKAEKYIELSKKNFGENYFNVGLSLVLSAYKNQKREMSHEQYKAKYGEDAGRWLIDILNFLNPGPFPITE